MISFKRYIREWVYMDPGSKRIMVVQNKEGKPAEYKSEEEAEKKAKEIKDFFEKVYDHFFDNDKKIFESSFEKPKI